MPHIPKTITVLRDSREQKKLMFPPSITVFNPNTGRSQVHKVKCSKATLESGDYAIKGFQHITAVERKGSIDELKDNLSVRDFKRFSTAFARFITSTKHPILFLDLPLASAFSPSVTKGISPGKTWDRIFHMATLGNCDILQAHTQSSKGSTKARQGEFILRRMIQFILQEKDQ